MSDLDCPSKRCAGVLSDPPDAVGTTDALTTVEWRTCGRCGRLVEIPVPLDHPTLDLGGGL